MTRRVEVALREYYLDGWGDEDGQNAAAWRENCYERMSRALAAADALAPPGLDREAVARVIFPDTFKLPRINLNRHAYDRAYAAADRVLGLLPAAPPAQPRYEDPRLAQARRASEIEAASHQKFLDEVATPAMAETLSTLKLAAPPPVPEDVRKARTAYHDASKRLHVGNWVHAREVYFDALRAWAEALLTTPAPPADTGDGGAGRLAELEAEREKWHSDACTQMDLRVAAERERDEARQATGFCIEQHSKTAMALSAAEARLARAREALERIAASRAGDMNTLHPDVCAHVAAETLRALADSEPAGRADQEERIMSKAQPQPHTFLGERGAHAANVTVGDIYKIVMERLQYYHSDRYDREAFCQAVCREIEKLNGTYPNVPGLKRSDP